MKSSIRAAKFVFQRAISELERVIKLIDLPQFSKIIKLIRVHRVWTTGMGKASLVARKMASTLACNNVAAGFIHGAEALHGDFGAIQPGDVLIAFSNSGKTYEILQIVEKAKKNHVIVIVLTSSITSTLSKMADISLAYGKIKEACSLGLTPTTSILVQLVLADAIAMAVQKDQGITYDDYARNHHAGYIGEIAKLKRQGR
jgi:arabinose-5-phosphate isomerase